MKLFFLSWRLVIFNRLCCALAFGSLVLIAFTFWKRGLSPHLPLQVTTLVLNLFLVMVSFEPPTILLIPDARGYLHHPWYGSYAARIPLAQGGTLMPGQRGDIEIDPEDFQRLLSGDLIELKPHKPRPEELN